MQGNLWEWLEDTWHDNHEVAPSDGSAWTSGGNRDLRIVRSDSWGFEPGYLRCTNGHLTEPSYRDVGFRPVQDLNP